jgi:hypothetical protein
VLTSGMFIEVARAELLVGERLAVGHVEWVWTTFAER